MQFSKILVHIIHGRIMYCEVIEKNKKTKTKTFHTNRSIVYGHDFATLPHLLKLEVGVQKCIHSDSGASRQVMVSPNQKSLLLLVAIKEVLLVLVVRRRNTRPKRDWIRQRLKR
jgi:hypothetical protein